MSTPTQQVSVVDPGREDLSITLELPADWTEFPRDGALPDQVIAIFSDEGRLSSGFTSSAAVIALDVPEGAVLEEWQASTRAEQIATLPDLQIFEDRLLDGEVPTWYRARVITGEGPATLLVREWSRVLEGRGLMLTITTVPMSDAAHAETLDAIAASWTTSTTEQNA